MGDLSSLDRWKELRSNTESRRYCEARAPAVNWGLAWRARRESGVPDTHCSAQPPGMAGSPVSGSRRVRVGWEEGAGWTEGWRVGHGEIGSSDRARS